MKDGTKIHNLLLVFFLLFFVGFLFDAELVPKDMKEYLCIQLVHINGQDTLVNNKWDLLLTLSSRKLKVMLCPQWLSQCLEGIE